MFAHLQTFFFVDCINFLFILVKEIHLQIYVSLRVINIVYYSHWTVFIQHDFFIIYLTPFYLFVLAFLRFPLTCDLSGACVWVWVKMGIHREREREIDKARERERVRESLLRLDRTYIYCSSIWYLLQCSSYICLL